MQTSGPSSNSATIEHVISRQQRNTDRLDSLVAACLGCNCARGGALGAYKFFRLRQRLLRNGAWPACSDPAPSVRRRLRKIAIRDGAEDKSDLKRYSILEVRDFIDYQFPGCPPDQRDFIASRASQRLWLRGTLSTAFAITAINSLSLAILASGRGRPTEQTKAEARALVKVIASATIESWRSVRQGAEVLVGTHQADDGGRQLDNSDAQAPAQLTECA